MKKLCFTDIADRIRKYPFPHADGAVGILRGGRVPASLVAFQEGLPLVYLDISFRDDDNRPMREQPQVGSIPHEIADWKNILVIDDVSVTGATLKQAEKALAPARVSTITLIGQADYVLFPEIKECVQWPWRIERDGRLDRA